jgi:hypothetical protein
MTTTTLTYGTTTVQLPDDLYWSDELEWQPTVQSAERTITGALVIQSATRIAGRPITLQPLEQTDSWFTRQLLETLWAWATVPDCEMLLSYRGITHNVTWRHHEGVVIQATPIVHYRDVVPEDWYSATLRFMEI